MDHAVARLVVQVGVAARAVRAGLLGRRRPGELAVRHGCVVAGDAVLAAVEQLVPIVAVAVALIGGVPARDDVAVVVLLHDLGAGVLRVLEPDDDGDQRKRRLGLRRRPRAEGVGTGRGLGGLDVGERHRLADAPVSGNVGASAQRGVGHLAGIVCQHRGRQSVRRCGLVGARPEREAEALARHVVPRLVGGALLHEAPLGRPNVVEELVAALPGLEGGAVGLDVALLDLQGRTGVGRAGREAQREGQHEEGEKRGALCAAGRLAGLVLHSSLSSMGISTFRINNVRIP